MYKLDNIRFAIFYYYLNSLNIGNNYTIYNDKYFIIILIYTVIKLKLILFWVDLDVFVNHIRPC